MIVKNEEQFIGQAIKSVKSVVDEIIVVDTGSTDNTCHIAKRLGAKIIHYKWDKNQGRARDTYRMAANSKWILVLDADEKIANKDLPRLKKLTENLSILGYSMPVRNYTKTYDLLRDWHSNKGEYPKEENFSKCPGWSLTNRIRLFQKKEGLYYKKGYSYHDYGLNLDKYSAKKIKNCDVAIHHFQFLKGKKNLLKKQTNYYKAELNYIKTNPNNSWGHLNIGIYFFKLKKNTLAIKHLNRAIEIDKNFDMAYFISGIVYKELAQHKKAIVYLNKAIAINPKYADAWAVLGMTYEDLGMLKEAAKALKKSIHINPDNVLAHNNLGIVYENSKRPKDAEKEYKTAIKLNPYFIEAKHNLDQLKTQ